METSLLVRKVLRSFGDDNGIFVKTDDVIDWINEAQLEIVRETNCLALETTALANAMPWTLPDDFLKTARVIYGTVPLKLADIESLDAMMYDLTVRDRPTFYYFVSGSLRLFPKALTTDSTVVTIQYTTTPALLTEEADQLTIPAVYHEDVVQFCKARAHERNENWRGMEIAMAAFDANVANRIDEADVQDEAYVVIRDDPTWSDF